MYVCKSHTSGEVQDIKTPVGNKESRNHTKSDALEVMELYTSISHESDRDVIPAASGEEFLSFENDACNATKQANGVSESMSSPDRSESERSTFAESRTDTSKLETERSNARKQTVYQNGLSLETSDGAWKKTKSAYLALVDLCRNNGHKCDPIAVFPERKELSRHKAETSKATTGIVGISKNMVAPKRCERNRSTLSAAESRKDVLKLQIGRSNATVQTNSQNILSPEICDEPWNHPESAVLALLDLSKGYEDDHYNISSASSDWFLSPETETRNGTIGQVGVYEFVSPVEKHSRFKGDTSLQRRVDLNIDSNQDDSEKLYAGYCCGYCVRPLTRHQRRTNVYKLKCERLVYNDEYENEKDKRKEDELLEKDYSSRYLVHRCDVQKVTPGTETGRCYLCFERFRCIFKFECHMKQQHKVSVIVICDKCMRYRSYAETLATRPLWARPSK